MAARTIPEPNEHHINNARFALMWQASRLKLDVDTPEMQEFINLIINVQAQQAAEIDWLRKILHNQIAGMEE